MHFSGTQTKQYYNIIPFWTSQSPLLVQLATCIDQLLLFMLTYTRAQFYYGRLSVHYKLYFSCMPGIEHDIVM